MHPEIHSLSDFNHFVGGVLLAVLLAYALLGVIGFSLAFIFGAIFRRKPPAQ